MASGASGGAAGDGASLQRIAEADGTGVAMATTSTAPTTTTAAAATAVRKAIPPPIAAEKRPPSIAKEKLPPPLPSNESGGSDGGSALPSNASLSSSSKESWLIDPEELQLEDKIGAGNFGTKKKIE